MTLLLVSGLSLVLMTKLFTAVDLLRENNTEFVLLKLIEILQICEELVFIPEI